MKEARAAQTILEGAAKSGHTGASVEAIRERLALLEELLEMSMAWMVRLALAPWSGRWQTRLDQRRAGRPGNHC